jgi:hypothetical protein
MAEHPQGSWPQREILGTKIKQIVFAQGLVDPKHYIKQRIIEVKASIPQFSALDSNLFFIPFQRAASVVILCNGHEAVELRHSRAAPLIAVRATPDKVATPVKHSEKVPLSKHTEKVPRSIMSASPFVLHLPDIVSTWTDEYQNSHANVLLAMPSGTQPDDLLSSIITKVDGLSVLQMKWKWPTVILDPSRMFGHSRFRGHLGVSHPKVVALVQTTDNVWGSNKICTSSMTIKLPSQEDYQFTPPNISRHDSTTLIVFPPPNEMGLIDPHATIFLLFDLMGKNLEDGKKYSMKASFKDNTELD